MEVKRYLMYPTESQKNIIENTFNTYMTIYNKLIEYSKKVGKPKALEYGTKSKLFRKINEMKMEDQSLSNLDSSTSEFLINHYSNDLNMNVTKYRRFPGKKRSVRHYPLSNNALHPNGIDFYNADYIQLPKLGYVRINRPDNIPINAKINKAKIEKDSASNYLLDIEYENLDSNDNIGVEREKRKTEFWKLYEQGYLPNGEKISEENISAKKNIRVLNYRTSTERRCNVLPGEEIKEKKHIVRINYVNRDYVKKLDEYEHAKKLYKKYPEKFSRGVIFGHTIILVEEDGIDFKVIYDKDPLSSYRKWNVPLLPREKELIKRNCQVGVLEHFPEVFEEEDIIDISSDDTSNTESVQSSEQQQQPIIQTPIIKPQQQKDIMQTSLIDNTPTEEYTFDSDIIIQDTVNIPKTSQRSEYNMPLSEEDELVNLLVNSNIYNRFPQGPIYPQQQQYPTQNHQYSGNNNWNYSGSYYNAMY